MFDKVLKTYCEKLHAVTVLIMLMEHIFLPVYFEVASDRAGHLFQRSF